MKEHAELLFNSANSIPMIPVIRRGQQFGLEATLRVPNPRSSNSRKVIGNSGGETRPTCVFPDNRGLRKTTPPHCTWTILTTLQWWWWLLPPHDRLSVGANLHLQRKWNILHWFQKKYSSLISCYTLYSEKIRRIQRQEHLRNRCPHTWNYW